ncbi:hypothetical protein L228DRAFT_249448 [Xylona heveae TC161]|uniref:Serine/arginine repetitive matrix protein 1 n=1 Tax=Xylona heveae (strain CBS 132557 / TC161) TaxID=1328760 RepID=A0A165F7K0_XYLHT|nr:hypothetical protein L228DRAFT_249448 [Xylona heveae TC161]KZF20667.1 hypothetical protein L228DRAFT_249448 [Xylona heveae TC161]
MERDWDRSRDRAMSGETYRPSQRIGRPFPPRDHFRSNRPSSVRNWSPPAGDSYVPAGSMRDSIRSRGRSPGPFRRESRSPHFRNKEVGTTWRERPRSPLPRRWSPRRESNRWNDRQRSPSRSGIMRTRSPYSGSGGRSPRTAPLKRERSLVEDRPIRSPPSKRERFASPPRGRSDRPLSPVRRQYSPARKGRYSPYLDTRPNRRSPSRSPVSREDRLETQAGGFRRRRSPSPLSRNMRSDYRSEHSSGRDSTSSSRRSPPIHPSRRALQQPTTSDVRSSAWSATHRPAHSSKFPPRSPHTQSPRVSRSPVRERSLPPRRRRSRPRSPPRGPTGYRSPLRGDDSPSGYAVDASAGGMVGDRQVSPGMAGAPFRSGDLSRAQSPTDASVGGPRDAVLTGTRSPPSGPSVPFSMPAHSRLNTVSVLSAPSQPRAGPNSRFPRDSSRESFLPPTYPTSRRPPSSHRPGFSRGGHRITSGPYEPHSRSPGQAPPSAVPTGPRSSRGPTVPSFSQPQPYRPSHSTTATTYPRTQHFTHHLSTIPALVPGGKILPSILKPEVVEKLTRLEEEKRKLMDLIDDKMIKKRLLLRDWERLERESAREGLKSDLAEQQLSIMTDEGGLGGSAF